MKVLAVYNVKGGVGKTATAVNLAFLAARDGRATLLWDLDPQGAASFIYRVRPRGAGGVKKLLAGKRPLDELVRGTDYPGLDLLPARFAYRKLDVALGGGERPSRRLAGLLRPLAETYDLLLLDCPPSLSLLAEAVFSLADGLLVPTIPTSLSLRALGQLARHLRRKGPTGALILPFLSLVDRRKRLHRDPAWLREASPFPLLAAAIPYSVLVEEMSRRRQPLLAYAPASPPAQAFEALWGEVAARLGE
jgi:chromosome partitioning protein